MPDDATTFDGMTLAQWEAALRSSVAGFIAFCVALPDEERATALRLGANLLNLKAVELAGPSPMPLPGLSLGAHPDGAPSGG